MTRPLPPLVSERLTDGRAGITSVCTAHPIAIEAALSLALRTCKRVLIEATCNQVNQEGGYTGMTPADFRRFVETSGAMPRSQQLTKVAPKLSPAPVGSTSSTSKAGWFRRASASK